MHSIRTLTVSFDRQKPASSMVKPACMPNTKNAPSSTQPVLIGLIESPGKAVLRGAPDALVRQVLAGHALAAP